MRRLTSFSCCACLFFWLIAACNSGYQEKNGKTLLNGKIVANENLKVLSDDFAKDSSMVYYNGQPIEDADAETFIPLDEHHGIDHKGVFYCDLFCESQDYFTSDKFVISRVKGADPESFGVLGNGYAKDKNAAFFEGKRFHVSHTASFKSINRSFAHDDVTAYFNRAPLAGSSGKTFQVINEHYARDAASVYFFELTDDPGMIAKLPASNTNIRFLDYPYATDGSVVFYRHQIVAGAEPSSFRVLKNSFASDKSSVFFQANKLPGADPASFTTFPESNELTYDFYYAKDKRLVYWQYSAVPLADVNSFTVIGAGYGRDGSGIFYKTKKVAGADPASFKVYPHVVGDADAEDKNNHYYRGGIARHKQLKLNGVPLGYLPPNRFVCIYVLSGKKR